MRDDPPPPIPPEDAPEAAAQADPPWGGAPLPPAEEPYPEDHPAHRMALAPAPDPTAPGPLGGLLGDERPPLPRGRRHAAAALLREVAAGIALAAAPLTAAPPGGPDLPFADVGAPAAAALLLGAASALDPLPAGEAHRHGRALWRLLATALVAWAAAGALHLPAAAPLGWVGAGLGLVTALRLARLGPEWDEDPQAPAPLGAPHRLARAALGGAAALIPPAMLAGLGADELRLLSRLFTLGLVVHTALSQRRVGRAGAAADQLRVGALTVAYRWILWVGMLTPLALVAVSLTIRPMASPALILAAILALPGLWGWAWLGSRAAQRAARAAEAPRSEDPGSAPRTDGGAGPG